MSAQPPGYNPGDSLLQGGNATIAPLMGGGGGFIEGTPDQSLLQGGTANIVPLKGGAGDDIFNAIEQAGIDAVASAPVHKVVAEVVEEMPEPNSTNLFNVIEKAGENAVASGPLYKVVAEVVPTEQFDIIQMARAAASGPTYSAVAEIVPQMPAPMVGGGDTEPISIESITLTGEGSLPDLSGEFPKLVDSYLDLIVPSWARFNILAPKTIELPKFLSKTRQCPPPSGELDDERGERGADRLVIVLPKSTTRIILFQPIRGDHTKFKQCLDYLNNDKTLDSDAVIIFAPPFFDATVDNQNLYANFLKLKLQLQEQKSAAIYLLTQNTFANRMVGCQLSKLVEDDYILNMLEPTYIVYPFPRTMPNETVPVGGILFSGAAADEVDAPASSIASRIASIGQFITIANRANFAFPPDPRVPDKMLGKVTPYKKYRFKGADAWEFEGVMNMKLKDDPGIDVEALTSYNDTQFLPFDPDHLILDEVQYERIPLNGEIYSIRKPGTGSGSITNDWISMRFTRDEAAMLNALNMRPEMLEEIFGDEWAIELTRFLENIVNSKCYTDTALITNAACDNSSEFIDRVFEYFLRHDARIRDLEERDNNVKLQQADILAGKARNTLATTEEKQLELENRIQAEMDSIKQRAELAGIDTKTDLAKMLKDPFKDKRLKYIRMGTAIEQQIYQNIYKTENWCRQVVAIHLRSKKYSKGEMSVPAKDQVDAMNQLKIEFDKIKEEYPGWRFLW
jgi:hypothetical protein